VSAGETAQSAWQLNEGFRLLAALPGRLSVDADVQTALGLVLLRKNVPREAAAYFERAVRLRPVEALRRLNLAAALAASGRGEEAVAELETALSQDPSLTEAYALLERIYREAGEVDQARAVRARYARESPLGRAGLRP
jgi:predicted Zn-dependent protease